MFQEQNEKCNICKCSIDSIKTEKTKYFSIDHCHTTGRVRGLLCPRCNTLLGGIDDKIDFLQRMINHLKE